MVIDDLISALLEFVASVPDWQRLLLAFVAIALETSILIGLIVPGDTVVLVAATATENWWQWAGLIIGCILGALLGESFGYFLGKVFRPRILQLLIRRKRWFRAWKSIERSVLRRGGPFIFLSRFLPVAHSLVPLAVGASGFAYKRFAIWTLPACAIWATLYASAGWAAGGTYAALADRLHGAGYIFVAIILAFMIIMWAAKKVIARFSRG
ncbi:DedA family protein [Agrococcus casei]|uniref:DedA protein n=1 Tax=Agrococcus casei LMG 22410 TaxID=1255656 RepID=A0A1R4FND4_9MICO|nr:DedA family protein [Agrococcus casei]SJM57333.1 DedA protein [Agrococcus casei LMG 22410]